MSPSSTRSCGSIRSTGHAGWDSSRGELRPPGAAIGGTAYVVGGYTGAQWLDTIVAWRPGTRARIVARLPLTAALRGRRRGRRAARDRRRLARERNRQLRRLRVHARRRGARSGSERFPRPQHTRRRRRSASRLPFGGRGAALDSPTTRIVAIDVARDRSGQPARSARPAPTSPPSRSAAGSWSRAGAARPATESGI